MDRAITTDLTMLLWTTVLCILISLPYILATIQTCGLVTAVGYPKPDDKPLPEWAQRSHRAHMNLIENIGPFAALVIIAHVAGAANETTALAATIYFWVRLLQAIVHTLGIPWVRTLAFFVSWAALLTIASQLF